RYTDAREQLLAWLAEVKQAKWLTPNDILDSFPSADFPGNHTVIFNIKGGHYRLIIRVRYASVKAQGTVFIRWFGTHKEYNRIKDVREI
ncbi:MAG TPA: type II toxin-antitoxin system HigB family toxin, partial [Chloroflexi bacterium]|nr:type II toxin-antitoxin system HigB family toxin [Chloroflexota bacterium]